MWVVLETHFQFNDETLYGGEVGEGRPIKAFTLEATAKAHAYDLLLKWFCNRDECDSQVDCIPYSVAKLEVDKDAAPTGLIHREGA